MFHLNLSKKVDASQADCCLASQGADSVGGTHGRGLNQERGGTCGAFSEYVPLCISWRQEGAEHCGLKAAA